MSNEPAHMQPFEIGYIAGLHGLDPRLCPFHKMTAEHREWQRWHRFGIMVTGRPWPNPVELYPADWVGYVALPPGATIVVWTDCNNAP